MNQQGGRILEGSSGIINSFARKEYAVSNDNVFPPKNPAAVASEVGDALAEVLRERARGLLAQAVAAEAAQFLARHGDQNERAGRARLARNGCLPERTIQTGIGEVVVKATRVLERACELLDQFLVPIYNADSALDAFAVRAGLDGL